MKRCFPAVVALLVIACPATISAQATDTVRVDVDGHTIVLYVSGSGPLVVMESGLGGSSRAWQAVVPELSKSARVVTYDRPGYGQSEPCDSARTAARISRELEQALDLAGIREPYHVVGWSFGGLVARVLAGLPSARVRGMVLVDPAPDGFYPRAAAELPDAFSSEQEGFIRQLFGDSTRIAEQRELAGFISSIQQARTSDGLHVLPTIVLIAGGPPAAPVDPMSPIWEEELVGWARRRQNAETEVIDGAGHHIARDRPSAVVSAVNRLLSRTASKR